MSERDLDIAPGQQGQEVLDTGFADHAVDQLLFCSDWGGAILGLQWTRVTGAALVHGPRAQRAGRALRALPVLFLVYRSPSFASLIVKACTV